MKWETREKSALADFSTKPLEMHIDHALARVTLKAQRAFSAPGESIGAKAKTNDSTLTFRDISAGAALSVLCETEYAHSQTTSSRREPDRPSADPPLARIDERAFANQA
jgi:hypothetical protein